jgi:hypothetical protein
VQVPSDFAIIPWLQVLSQVWVTGFQFWLVAQLIQFLPSQPSVPGHTHELPIKVAPPLQEVGVVVDVELGLGLGVTLELEEGVGLGLEPGPVFPPAPPPLTPATRSLVPD